MCASFIIDPTYDHFRARHKRLPFITNNTIYDLYKRDEDAFEDRVRLTHESQVIEAIALETGAVEEVALKQAKEEVALKQLNWMPTMPKSIKF